MEPFYPLLALVCDDCFLVHLQEYVNPQAIFSDSAYFPSSAESWLDQVLTYADQMIARWNLTSSHRVVASDDGYLLQTFVARSVPALGIEPAATFAAVAMGKGVPTRLAFFGQQTARALAAKNSQADLRAS